MKTQHQIAIAAALAIIFAAGAQALQTQTMRTVCKNDHLLVPAREVFETLGTTVIWSAATRTVTATGERTRIILQVEYPRAQINGREYELPVAPVISDGHVMVPVRFAAESLGWDVSYRQGKVELTPPEGETVRITPAGGPPMCVLDEQTSTEDPEGDDTPADEEDPAQPRAEQRPIDCDISGFKKTVLQADKPVLVDFWAPWCGPCLMMQPTMDRIARRYAGRAKIVRVDISKSCNQPLVLEYNVRTIPYVAVFSDGRIVQNLVGVRPEQVFAAALDQVLQK